MNKEKMKEIQSIRPQKRYFVLNRDGLVDRAVNTLVALGRSQFDPTTVMHPHLAPLTKDEKKLARARAVEVLTTKRRPPQVA